MKKVRNKFYKCLFGIASLFLLAVILPLSASAITISPLKIDISLYPGQTQQYELLLFNETKEPIYLTGSLEAVTPRGENGEAEVSKPDQSNLAVSWVKLPVNSFEIKPGQIAHVPVIVNVPSTAQVGGYYLASMWQTSFASKKDESQVGVSARVGAILLIRVEGDVKEELKVADFKITGKSLDYRQADFSARLENSGNVHVAPQGQLIIKNMFGKVCASLPFNEAAGNILPTSIRQFNNEWGQRGESGFFQGFVNEWKGFGLGRYSARLDLEYGESRQRLQSEEISWWIIPWRTVVIIIVIVLIIIGLIFGKRSKKSVASLADSAKEQF